MQVSIVIPTYNEAKNLPHLLDCLRKQTFQDFDIIVADNHSKDNTREIAARHKAKIVDGGLPAEGRNSGARYAQGEVLFFLDADVLVDKYFLEKNLENFLKRDLDFAMPRFKTSSSHRRDKFIFGFQNVWIKKTHKLKPYTMGFGTVVRKKAFDQVHGFDERMNLGEDADLGFRLRKAGFKFGILPDPLLVSARRFAKNGRLKHSVKMLYSGLIQTVGVAPDKHLKYEWGYEKKDRSR